MLRADDAESELTPQPNLHDLAALLQRMREAGLPEYEAGSWYGIEAPAGTPRPIIEQLNAVIVKALQQPDVAKRLAAEGAEVIGSTPEEFGALQRTEIAKWGGVIRTAKIQVE